MTSLLRTLQRPIVAAPMAGGPSTPELVAAVAEAGGLGFLAGGYLSPDALVERIEQTRELTGVAFGVNLFVPADLDRDRDLAAVQEYADRLRFGARRLGAKLGSVDWHDRDRFEDKVTLLLDDPVAVVSFTFGIPPEHVITALHGCGTEVVITVTDPDEALAAARAGAAALCIQGAAAGGHRGTHDAAAIPNEDSWTELLRRCRSVAALPMIVCGGIMTRAQVEFALQSGAAAVQCGTAFLLTDEAGTSSAARAGLTDRTLTRSVVTRAFSGRPARGVRNEFIEQFDEFAPPVYPVVDQITKPVRAAAAADGNYQWVSLWAGTGWESARTGPAAAVVEGLHPARVLRPQPLSRGVGAGLD